MVGYSALAQRNEPLALELLGEHRGLLRRLLPKHQGTEIKTTGDGFLLEFASALTAVQYAVEIQQALAARNVVQAVERQILIRIGIHLGDVVRREGDVIGDGVIIAARIEPLAEPGGIGISRAVFEQVLGKLAETMTSAGEVDLKRRFPRCAGAWNSIQTSPSVAGCQFQRKPMNLVARNSDFQCDIRASFATSFSN